MIIMTTIVYYNIPLYYAPQHVHYYITVYVRDGITLYC